MAQSSLAKQELKAKKLSCIFQDSVLKYSDLKLKACKTKRSQYWRHT
ncbi:3748_t:CDS:1, partial [Cetraspora pellucida]